MNAEELLFNKEMTEKQAQFDKMTGKYNLCSDYQYNKIKYNIIQQSKNILDNMEKLFTGKSIDDYNMMAYIPDKQVFKVKTSFSCLEERDNAAFELIMDIISFNGYNVHSYPENDTGNMFLIMEIDLNGDNYDN